MSILETGLCKLFSCIGFLKLSDVLFVKFTLMKQTF